MQFTKSFSICLLIISITPPSGSGLHIIRNSDYDTVAVEEASGVTRQGDYLLIVSDKDPGVYYKYGPLTGQEREIKLEGEKVSQVNWPTSALAFDLEGIETLADGKVAVLSERLRMLIGETGVIAHYEDQLAEVGARGLEGVAVRSELGKSRIAVLWEGGYFNYPDIPRQIKEIYADTTIRRAFNPLIFIHDLKPLEYNAKKIKMESGVSISIKTPMHDIEPKAQRFRAPDLVWYKLNETDWGFILLLNSENSVDTPSYQHSWLQKFDIDGHAIGQPVDLKTKVSEKLKVANWEGLGWFEDQKSLVLVHDIPLKGTSTAVIFQLDSLWPANKRLSKNKIDSAIVLGRINDSCISQTAQLELFENWKKSSLIRTLPEAEFDDYLIQERPRVQNLPDPFTPIANDTIERNRRGETVLWENSEAMVLVDKFNKSKPLVIPKSRFNYFSDVPPNLQKRLSSVAEITSDALRWASNNCNANCRIYINPVHTIGVAQLHIHVHPNFAIGDITKGVLNKRIRQYLGNHL